MYVDRGPLKIVGARGPRFNAPVALAVAKALYKISGMNLQ